jgi:cytochrome c-type biogenesis protein CcmH/NrfG
MAIISLRAYNREIEGMIDNGQLDEAVAHCRHILATFPKHIASYRLLGKAHLEQQRISDATDIFQRVLSAIPDDFISNVGMSIIREDENNLDAAIWHMELAYEVQPANAAIQDELRRLYGRRDGMQPAKPRLTRGALARMYAKGGLFDQAIAELRAAIAEDPNRPDLQLLLAQMFFQTSQRVEAVDTCVTILKKMPLCLDANRILAISLPDAENSDAVKNSRQIVVSMDPYYAFAEPESITSDQVAESAVNIDRLEWKSGLQIPETPSQPNWATSLGISMNKPTEENIPDWLKQAEAPAAQSLDVKSSPGVSPFIWDTQEVEKIITDTSKTEGEIPDWMKDAGWKPSSGEATPPMEETVQPGDVSIAPPVSEDLQQADIPDWLRGIAPEDFTGPGGQKSQPEEDSLSNPWLEPHQPGPTDSIIQWLEEKQPDSSMPPRVQGNNLAFSPDDEVPDWLKDLDIESTSSPHEIPVVAAAALSSLPSAFLDEPVSSGTAEIETTPVDKAVEPAGEPPAPQLETPPVPRTVAAEAPDTSFVEEIPDWLKEIAVAVPVAGVIASAVEKPPEETPPAVEPVVESVAALEQAAVSESTPVEEMPLEEPSPMAEPVAEPFVEPQASIEQAVVTETPPVEGIPPGAEETLAQELPEADKTSPDSSLPIAAGALLAAEMHAKQLEQPVNEQPPEMDAQASAETTIPLESPPLEGASLAAGFAASELPNLSEELPPPESTPQPIDQPQIDLLLPVGTEIPVTPPGSMNEADAFAWLEGLAAEQDAMGEGSVTQPVEGEFQPPDWVKLETTPITEAQVSDQPPVNDQEQALPAEEIPDWLKGLGEESPTDRFSEPPFSVTPPPTEQAVTEPIEAEPENLDELPAWILEMDQPEPVKEIPGQAEEELEWKLEELPDWLKEITESEGTDQLTPSEAPLSAAEIEASAAIAGLSQAEEAPQESTPAHEPVSAADIAAAGIIAGFVHTDQPTPPSDQVLQVAEIPQPEVPLMEQVETEPTPVSEEITPETVETTQLEPQALVGTPVEMLPDPAEAVLSDARTALSQGQSSQAVGFYTSLIKQNAHLSEVIHDLQDALYRFPVDVDLWVTLGDAHCHSNELQEALNAYTKAEELVR